MPTIRQLAVAGVLVLGACSGDDASPSGETVPDPATTTVVPAADDAAPASSAVDSDATLATKSSDWTVTVDVRAEGFEGGAIDTAVNWTGDPASTIEDGPFGRFGSCSGLRAYVGAYSVLVSGGDGLDAVSIWTADRVVAAGIYDAEVRIERDGAAPITATGTMTILDDLQQGEFQAFGPSGGRVDGTFSCLGTVPPTPLRADPVDGDGSVDAVEVFTLLRDGAAERVMGLAAGASAGAECPGVEGRSSPVIVSVAGDAALGGITTFELSGDPSAAVLRAGGAGYEFEDVVVTLDEGGASGVFSGTTADGIAVDGAFHCT